MWRLGVHRLVTCLGATVGWLLTYLPPFRWTMGPHGRFWEWLRRHIAVPLGRWFDDRAGPREITYGEYVGRYEGSVSDLEALLWQRGFRRNPLARPKTRNGVPEAGSWAKRNSPWAARQVHVMLFSLPQEGVDIYAHEEVSSVNPRLAAAHFTGHSMQVATGVERMRKLLPLDTTHAPVAMPEGHWTTGTQEHPSEIIERR